MRTGKGFNPRGVDPSVEPDPGTQRLGTTGHRLGSSEIRTSDSPVTTWAVLGGHRPKPNLFIRRREA